LGWVPPPAPPRPAPAGGGAPSRPVCPLRPRSRGPFVPTPSRGPA